MNLAILREKLAIDCSLDDSQDFANKKLASLKWSNYKQEKQVIALS